MKLIILFSVFAIIVAAPLDEKSQPTTLDSNKPPLNSDFKSKTPLANPVASNNHNKPKRDTQSPQQTVKSDKAPVNQNQKTKTPSADPTPLNSKPKRDTVKTTDQKNTNVPQKNTAPIAPNPVAVNAGKAPSNNRPSRDTQKTQDSYKPQPSGIPQKSNLPLNPASSDPTKTQSNVRPNRDTPKTDNNQQPPQKNSAPTTTNNSDNKNTRPKRDTVKASNPQQTPNTQQKKLSPAPVPSSADTKTQSQKTRRDTPIANKQADNNQKPVEWNKNEKKAENQPQTSDNRKTRETQKTNTPVQVKDDKAKTSNPTQHQSDVVRVPLTSTNSRNRRDAPNPAEQSKLVPSGSISGKIETPSSQARQPSSQSNSNIRRPAPVDQILRQKASEAKLVANDNSKPQENAEKKN